MKTRYKVELTAILLSPSGTEERQLFYHLLELLAFEPVLAVAKQAKPEVSKGIIKMSVETEDIIAFTECLYALLVPLYRCGLEQIEVKQTLIEATKLDQSDVTKQKLADLEWPKDRNAVERLQKRLAAVDITTVGDLLKFAPSELRAELGQEFDLDEYDLHTLRLVLATIGVSYLSPVD